RSILLQFKQQPAGADAERYYGIHGRGQFHHQSLPRLYFRGRLRKDQLRQRKKPRDLDEVGVLSDAVSDHSDRSRELLRLLQDFHENSSTRILATLMNTTLARDRKTKEGSVLFMVLILIVIAFLMLSSALSWSSNNATTIARNSQYWQTVGAAEAATEKILTRLSRDFQSVNGEDTVYRTLMKESYAQQVPTAAEDGYWSTYVFSDGQGNKDRTYVTLVPGTRTNWTALNSQYSGLFGVTDAYQVRSYARDTLGRFDVSAGVQQNVQL